MRGALIVAAAVILSGTIVDWSSAAPRHGRNEPRPPIGSNPHPVIWGGAKARPTPARPQSPQPNQARQRHPDQRGHDRNHSRHHGGGHYPNVLPYYFVPYYHDLGYYNIYPYYYPYYPPYYAPQWPIEPVDPPREVDPPRAAAPPEPRADDFRATNAHAVALAWKFIGYGDAQFARGEFAEANDRYRKAARSGPQVADAWFREGFALTAMGRYDLAVAAVRRGLEIDPKWSASGFDLDTLFGRDAAAKQAHLDALIKAADDDPLNADLLFLVGVHLHFDGQSALAEKYFQRARRIAGDQAEHVFAFLGKEAQKR